MISEIEGATGGTPPQTDNATEEIAQAATEVTAASPDVQAESTSPASELDEFKADVAKAKGDEPPKPESESEADETAPETTDEPEAESAKEKDEDALSQDEQAKAPEKLTDKPEWQALTKIADKLGPAAGKETRKILRGLFRREHDLSSAVEKLKPNQEIVQEMIQSVGGSEQGFKNMRHLIKSFDSDPHGAVPMLETLLNDAKKRAGMVLQSPELLTESQQLDKQVEEGSMEQAAADKRKSELLELEQARVGVKRSTQQTEQQRQQTEAQAARKQHEAWIAETNQAETNWVNDKTKNDPDFGAVQEVWAAFAQQRALGFANKEGRRPNGKESVQILESALKDAKAQAMKFKPKPKAFKPINGDSNGSSGNNRQQPANEFDEFKQSVEDARKRH